MELKEITAVVAEVLKDTVPKVDTELANRDREAVAAFMTRFRQLDNSVLALMNTLVPKNAENKRDFSKIAWIGNADLTQYKADCDAAMDAARGVAAEVAKQEAASLKHIQEAAMEANKAIMLMLGDARAAADALRADAEAARAEARAALSEAKKLLESVQLGAAETAKPLAVQALDKAVSNPLPKVAEVMTEARALLEALDAKPGAVEATKPEGGNLGAADAELVPAKPIKETIPVDAVVVDGRHGVKLSKEALPEVLDDFPEML